MYYDPSRHHGKQQARPREPRFLRCTENKRKFQFDSMEAVAHSRFERETQRVMDGLLRECLRHKPLTP